MFVNPESSRTLGLHSVLVGLALVGQAVNAQPSTPASGVRGAPRFGAAGVRETTAQIMARDRLLGAQPVQRHVAPRFVLPPEAASISINALGMTPSPSGEAPLAQQTVSPTINFTAATFSDCSGWPPDTMGAVGPTQFIIALNGRVRSFNKAAGTNDGVLNADTDVFFSSVMTPGSNLTTDPRIRYDRLSGRWFITMIDVPGRSGHLPNRVMIAVSDSGIVTGSTVWTFFYFAGDASDFADYPTLGIDATALYIGANIFSASSGSFANTSAYVVRKSSLLSGGPIVVTTFTDLISGHGPNVAGPFTPQGVDNYDPAATEGYFIGVDRNSTSKLQLRRVSNPGGSPTLSGNVTINVTSFSSPINPTVQGTSGTLDGLDKRLIAAHFRNGSLWTSHNVGVNSSGGTGSPDRNGIRWYQITGILTGQAPLVAQSGTVYKSGSAALSYWMGSLVVSGQGHAAMGFTQGGPNDYLDAATTGRAAGDPAGTMGIPVAYTTSTSAYTPSDNSSPHRWGDYSYTSVDPSDDMTMWTIQEWCQTGGDGYAVQVAKLLAPPPALPTNCTPGSLSQGASNVNVVIRGSAANGAGFFDPGAGFSNRLSAAINGGGVTVNSLTYSNPTNVTVNLTVASNAAVSTRTVTVTNPDGQSATSATGLLAIVGTGNLPPTLAPIDDQTIAVGTTLVLTNSASDPNGDPLTFSLVSGTVTNATLNPTNGLFTWAPTAAEIGIQGFHVMVSDNGSPPLSATQSFSVLVVQSNTPPVLPPIADRTIAVGMALTITNIATDPDGDALTYSLGPGAAANAALNATNGIFQWTPDPSQLGGNPFSVIVTDSGAIPLSATQTFNVTVLHSNTAPVLEPIPDQIVAVGMILTLTNGASDPDGDALLFSLEAGPVTNAFLNPTNGTFTWQPEQSQIGSNYFQVIVTDDGLPPLGATQGFAVTVLASNIPPVLSPIGPRTRYAGQTLILTNSAFDPDVPPQSLTFSLDPGAPAGAIIGATNGVLEWTPTAVQLGTNFMTVRVTDDGLPNLSAAQLLSVDVIPPPLLSVSYPTNVTTLTWSAVTGATYRVQFETNLAEPAWVDLVPDIVATGAIAIATDPAATNDARFYRILLVP